jgi:inhibitor of cysteine peptidase
MSGTVLTAADSGKSLSVTIGDKVILQLNENPTSGFLWALDRYNSEIIELRSSDYIRAPASAVGGSGQRLFVFQAKSSGNVHLSLKLRRQWDTAKPIASIFDVSVRVSN